MSDSREVVFHADDDDAARLDWLESHTMTLARVDYDGACRKPWSVYYEQAAGEHTTLRGEGDTIREAIDAARGHPSPKYLNWLRTDERLRARVWYCDECQEWRLAVEDTDTVADPPETTLRCAVCSHPIAEFRGDAPPYGRRDP